MSENEKFKILMGMIISLLQVEEVITQKQAMGMTKLIAHAMFVSEEEELNVYEYLDKVK